MTPLTDAERACDVCWGTPGWYPVIDRYGQHLYNIRCPHCGGTGKDAAQDVAPERTDSSTSIP
jgi:hypothetical protein